MENTGSIGKRLVSSGVKVEAEGAGSSSKVLAHHHELHHGVLRSVNCKVGGLAVHLSLTDINSGHEEGVLVGNGGGFCAASEVDLAVVVTESYTSNNEGHSTRNLRLLGLNAGNSIGRSNNLGDVENV
jgi:hypothetical protein